MELRLRDRLDHYRGLALVAQTDASAVARDAYRAVRCVVRGDGLGWLMQGRLCSAKAWTANHLRCGALGNTYWGVRHGLSVPNQEKIVVANPLHGALPKYGLVPEGRRKAREHFARWTHENAWVGRAVGTGKVLVLSSDFSRAHETAILFAQAIGYPVDRIEKRPALRERFFGRYELQSVAPVLGGESIYDRIWSRDADNPAHTDGGVESANALSRRLIGLVVQQDRLLGSGMSVFLVSHWDPLLAVHNAFHDQPPGNRFLIENAAVLRLST